MTTENPSAPLSTSDGARCYIAHFFAREMRRHDFATYIATELAADFACALAQHLAETGKQQVGEVEGEGLATIIAALEHSKPTHDHYPEPVKRHADALAHARALAARQPVGYIPDGVWEALQRIIENSALHGPASNEDAILVARYRRDLLAARQPGAKTFQAGVSEWMGQCFLPSLYSNMTERGDRLLEEVLELLQAHGYDQGRIATLVQYVYGRPVGEPAQEVGGVMVTLAGYCWVAGLDMHAAGDAELQRITQPEVMDKIRQKQEAKNALHFDTPLPGHAAPPAQGIDLGPGVQAIAIERQRQMANERFTSTHDEQYQRGELAKAAVAYAQLAAMELDAGTRGHIGWLNPPAIWPWEAHWWKPVDARRDLVRAGALIAAQLDLIDQRDSVRGRGND